jgi:hypothetical protein
MINNVIEINTKDKEDIIITHIEHFLEYLNQTSDESDNIEKELEEKYKEEIDNLKAYTHNFHLLDKCFTTMKTKKTYLILIIFIFASQKMSTDGWLYMIQRGYHRKLHEPIYNIGHTNDFNRRINEYPEYSKII